MTANRPDFPTYHIVFCITELDVGGAEQCLVKLVTRLDPDRFRPTVVSLAAAPPTGKDQLVRQLQLADVPLHFLGFRKPRQFLGATRSLTNLVTELHPDLVQTFLFHANVVGACACRRADNVPHVAGIRVADPRSRFRHWIERKFTQSTAKYVCVSQDVARFAVHTTRLPDDKIVVIPNGVDVARFNSRPADLLALGVPADRTILLYVGRLDPQKRIDRLLTAVEHLNCDEPRFHLVLVGDGPAVSDLQKMIDQQQIAQYVSFAGWQESVEPFFAAADVVVMTSDWEGMPNALLEGMAAGLPVVAYECEGVSELLGDLSEPQIVSGGTDDERIHALVDRVRQIAADNELAKRLSNENRSRAQQHFSIEAMVDSYQRLYASLLDAERGANME